MEFRTLRPDELDAWASHCEAVFAGVGHSVDKSYFLNHYHNDPWRDINGIFVAADAGRIVSTVRVFRRSVWLFGAEVPMGGIGEVSTNPDYRGRGLAGALIEKATRWMEGQGIPVSVLFSGLYDFYRKYGWECIPKPVRRYARPIAKPCEGWALRPEDRPALMAMDLAADKMDWLTVRKEPLYWKLWMEGAINRCVVAAREGQLVAWMAYSLMDGYWQVSDFRPLPGFGHVFDGLCALAAALEGREGQPFVAPAWYPSANADDEDYTLMFNMVRLNAPLDAGGRRIATTRQLIDETREFRDSSLDHF